MQPSHPIETKRLVLRPLRADDADALYAYRSREDVCRYLLHPPQTYDDVKTFISTHSHTELTEVDQGLTFAVIERETETLVGDVVLIWRSKEHRGAEVGYAFNPDHSGHGYATEASAAMLRLGFDEFGFHRIIGRLDARNTPSARVLERLGMRREAHLVENEFFKGEWTDEVIYATLAHEWRDPT